MTESVDQTSRKEKAKFDKDYCKKWEEEDERLMVLDIKKKPVKERRIIRHALFKDLDYKSAEKYLCGEGVKDGECVIRPSTRGNEHVSLSWKIHAGIVLHIGIKKMY